MTIHISKEEWIKELERVSEEPDAIGLSMDEIAEKMDIHVRTARDRIKVAVKKGFWIYVGERKSTRISGTPYHIPVYAPVKQKGKGKCQTKQKARNKK